MLGSQYITFEHGQFYEDIEEALLTSCPYCGTELEWSLTVSWDNKLEKPVISGLAYSCGVTFAIRPINEPWANKSSYYLEEKGKEENESY